MMSSAASEPGMPGFLPSTLSLTPAPPQPMAPPFRNPETQPQLSCLLLDCHSQVPNLDSDLVDSTSLIFFLSLHFLPVANAGIQATVISHLLGSLPDLVLFPEIDFAHEDRLDM